MADRSVGAGAPLRVPRRFWAGLVAVVVYVLLAAGLGNLVPADFGAEDDPALEFDLSHLIPLPLAIVAGLGFARWAGWWDAVWRAPSAVRIRPRRWWMLLIPALLLAQSVATVTTAPWSERAGTFIGVVALGTLLVGFGEELAFRGILRASLTSHHGELVTLLVTSLLFGLAHTAGSLVAGLDPGFIAFQVAITAMDGALFYGAFRSTGTLWAPILLHALGDFSLYLASGAGSPAEGDVAPFDGGGLQVAIQLVLVMLSVALVVSVALEDRRARRAEREQRPIG